jgi:hypothetical protein
MGTPWGQVVCRLDQHSHHHHGSATPAAAGSPSCQPYGLGPQQLFQMLVRGGQHMVVLSIA